MSDEWEVRAPPPIHSWTLGLSGLVPLLQPWPWASPSLCAAPGTGAGAPRRGIAPEWWSRLTTRWLPLLA